jgi:hypothetical protein
VVTGHGFKDPASLEKIPGVKPLIPIEVERLAHTVGEMSSVETAGKIA